MPKTEKEPSVKPQTETKEPVYAKPKAKTSLSLLVIILILAVLVTTITAAFFAFSAYQLKQQVAKNITKPITDQPIIQPTSQLKPNSQTESQIDSFQQILGKYCQKIDLATGVSFSGIQPAFLPVSFDTNNLNIEFEKDNTFICAGDPQSKNGYIRINSDKGAVNVSDKNSQELGHGGPPFLGSLDTIIKDDGNIKLSIALGWPGAGCSQIGDLPLLLRGEKKIQSASGETIFINTQAVAIEENDPRLIAVLQEKTKSCEFDGQNTIEPDPQGLEEKIKQRFFSDFDNLENPEKQAITAINNTLNAFLPKKITPLDKQTAIDIVEQEMGFCDCRRRIVDLDQNGYAWEVTVTDEGLKDDSIEAIKTIFLMDIKNKIWTAEKLSQQYRCAPGRGQQNFSPELCL